jgi:hypothetical protein
MHHQQKQEALSVEIVTLASKLLELYQWESEDVNHESICTLIEAMHVKLNELKSSLG